MGLNCPVINDSWPSSLGRRKKGRKLVLASLANKSFKLSEFFGDQPKAYVRCCSLWTLSILFFYWFFFVLVPCGGVLCVCDGKQRSRVTSARTGTSSQSQSSLEVNGNEDPEPGPGGSGRSSSCAKIDQGTQTPENIARETRIFTLRSLKLHLNVAAPTNLHLR